MAKQTPRDPGSAGLLDREDLREHKHRDEMARDVKRVYRVIGLALAAGVLVLGFFSLGPKSLESDFFLAWVYSFSRLALVAGASFAALALAGFLFGIPRTMQAQPVAGQAQGAGSPPAEAQPVNTNLEQVSDWLTKIIVGVGLTQLNTLPSWMWGVAGDLSGSATGHDTQVVIVTAMVYFGVVGFLGGYLLTRLFLANALVEADIARRRAGRDSALATTSAGSAQRQIASKLIAKIEAAGGSYLPTSDELADPAFMSAVESLVGAGTIVPVDREALASGASLKLADAG